MGNFDIALEIAKAIVRRRFDTSKYCIRKGYRHRTEIEYYDDRDGGDTWQLEVYEAARKLADEHGLKSVVDLGCGSGFKLLKYLGHLDTTGVDLEPTLSYLKNKYPDNRWLNGDQLIPGALSAQLVISSDVIEHVLDPDAMLETIKGVAGLEYLVISTPERNICRGWYDFGPPDNPAHVREWNGIEFRNYISQHFDILSHQVTHYEQGTQMMICRPKGA